jgi:hypothetical protein
VPSLLIFTLQPPLALVKTGGISW